MTSSSNRWRLINSSLIHNSKDNKDSHNSHRLSAIVSAGESDHHIDSTEDDDDNDDDDDDEALKYTTDDQLDGANLDDEDEAWVY
jgi:uncharacterized membrane protein YebE (DUF533 family)